MTRPPRQNDEMTAAELASQIEVLQEAGSDGGGWMGYWCKGHHDPELFAVACNYYGGHDEDSRRHIRAAYVAHERWRTVPIADDPGMYRFMPAKPGARGAFKVTVADVQALWVKRDSQIRSESRDHGRRAGIADALRFCAERFGVDFADLVAAWNETRP